jgi:hypothetical protein
MNSIFNAAIGPLLTYGLPILAIVAFSIYVLVRVKSPQILREKIWRSFVGDVDFSEDFLQAFSAQQRDLNRFRLVYGVGARSTSQLRTLLAWMDRKAVTIDEVRRVRDWINVEKPEVLSTPPRKLFIVLPIVVGILVVALALLLFAADSPFTTLKMRDSGVWFWSDGKSVQSLMHQWTFDAQSCVVHANPEPSVTGFTIKETQILCAALADGSAAKVVRTALIPQRVALAIVACPLFTGLFMFFFELQSGRRARELSNRLNLSPSPELTSDNSDGNEIEIALNDG